VRARTKALAGFTRWAVMRGATAAPVPPETVVDYVDYLAGEGRSPATIKQAVWAIGAQHRAADLADPTKAEVVRLALRRIARVRPGLTTRLPPGPYLRDAPEEGEPEPVRRGREAMAKMVSDYADPARPWELVMQGRGTCKARRCPVADLVPMIPTGLTWAEVTPRLSCDLCGAPADIIGLAGPPAHPDLGQTWLLLQKGETSRWR